MLSHLLQRPHQVRSVLHPPGTTDNTVFVMDTFSGLSWNKNASTSSTSLANSIGSTDPSRPDSRQSSRPVSRNAVSLDAFADLAINGKPKKAMESTLSLAERQANMESFRQQSASPMNNSAGNGNSLDPSWSGLDFLSERPSQNAEPTTGNPSESVSQRTSSNDLDDIFDVFNRPPEVIKQEKEREERERAEREKAEMERAEKKKKIEKEKERAKQIKDRLGNAKSSNNGSNSNDSIVSSSKQIHQHPRELRQDSIENNISSRSRSHSQTGFRDHRAPSKAAVNELMDMGFSEAQAVNALENTTNGDISEAVDFLMRQAHERSARPSQAHRTEEVPNISKITQELSTQFISRAGFLLSQGRKNLVKALDKYTQEDDGTPAWMRNASRAELGSQEIPRTSQTPKRIPRESTQSHTPRHIEPKTTNEALALESHDRPTSKKAPRKDSWQEPSWRDEQIPVPVRANAAQRDLKSPDSQRSTFKDPRPSTPPVRPIAVNPAQQFKSKGFYDEDLSYVSSRRRAPRTKATASPTPISSPITSTSRSSTPSRPPPPTRPVITITSQQIETFTPLRESGTEAFKRGDFTQATVHYTEALEILPEKHLLRSIILSNRASSNLKLGDSKAALVDADLGLSLIGEGLGEGELAEPGKSLKQIWSKLVTRKAEALESLERYEDALKCWNLLVENGFSSAVAMAGKRRCLAVLNPPAPSPAPSVKPSRSSTPSFNPASAEAVKKVRQANLEAEKVEEEKFQLLDGVGARVDQWRNGKMENLRGLLSTLDTILWPELNWKKLSLAELVMPKKVKIAYMKAVAKTHPDKLSPNATTEEKMIAQGVFVTLNQAWDEFKKTNNIT